MHSPAILVVWMFPDFERAEVEKNFEIISSPTTFRPEMLEWWNVVVSVKWFWNGSEIWKGVASYKGFRKNLLSKRQRQIGLKIGRDKSALRNLLEKLKISQFQSGSCASLSTYAFHTAEQNCCPRASHFSLRAPGSEIWTHKTHKKSEKCPIWQKKLSKKCCFPAKRQHELRI